MKQSLTLLFFFCILHFSFAQNVGIGTTTPGSKLQVAGSFAPNYTVVTTTPYNLGVNDYYVLFQGGFSSGLFRLPASTAALKGRNYFIKNGAGNPLTIKAAVNETIDGDSAITLVSGEVAHIVMKGATGSGMSTSEVVAVSQGSYYFLGPGVTVRPWTTAGNSGTTADVNFIGTTDQQDFVTRTYGIERMRVTKDGMVGIGTSNPASPLHVESSNHNTQGLFLSSFDSNEDSGVLRAEFTGTSTAGKTAIIGQTASGIGVKGIGNYAGLEGIAIPAAGYTYPTHGMMGVCTRLDGTGYGVVGIANNYQNASNSGTRVGGVWHSEWRSG